MENKKTAMRINLLSKPRLMEFSHYKVVACERVIFATNLVIQFILFTYTLLACQRKSSGPCVLENKMSPKHLYKTCDQFSTECGKTKTKAITCQLHYTQLISDCKTNSKLENSEYETIVAFVYVFPHLIILQGF